MSTTNIIPSNVDDDYLYTVLNKKQYIDADSISGLHKDVLVTKQVASITTVKYNRTDSHLIPKLEIVPAVNAGTTSIRVFVPGSSHVYGDSVDYVEIIVSETVDFSTIVTSSVLELGKYFTPQLKTGVNYFVRARGISNGIVGEWSGVYVFTVSDTSNNAHIRDFKTVVSGTTLLIKVNGPYPSGSLDNIGTYRVYIYEDYNFKMGPTLTTTEITDTLRIEDAILPNRHYKIVLYADMNGSIVYLGEHSFDSAKTDSEEIETFSRRLSPTTSGYILADDGVLYYVGGYSFAVDDTAVVPNKTISPIQDKDYHPILLDYIPRKVLCAPSGCGGVIVKDDPTDPTHTRIAVHYNGAYGLPYNIAIPGVANIAAADNGLIYLGGSLETGADRGPTIDYISNNGGVSVANLPAYFVDPLPVVTSEGVIAVFVGENSYHGVHIYMPPYTTSTYHDLDKYFNYTRDAACGLPSGLIAVRHKNTVYTLDPKASSIKLMFKYILTEQAADSYGNIVPVGIDKIAILDRRNDNEKILILKV